RSVRFTCRTKRRSWKKPSLNGGRSGRPRPGMRSTTSSVGGSRPGAWTLRRSGLNEPTSRFVRSRGSLVRRSSTRAKSSPQKKALVPEQLSKDMSELLEALNRRHAQYLVIGAHAVGVYAEPRGTKDLDIWVNPTKTNARRVHAALKDFGAPLYGTTENALTRK